MSLKPSTSACHCCWPVTTPLRQHAQLAKLAMADACRATHAARLVVVVLEEHIQWLGQLKHARYLKGSRASCCSREQLPPQGLLEGLCHVGARTMLRYCVFGPCKPV